MRLSLKLTITLTCAILLVLAANSVIRVRRELDLFKHDMRQDSKVLGRAVAGAAGRIWFRVGEAEAIDVVEDANQRETHVLIRWVWLDAPEGHDDAPVDPSAAEAAMISYFPVDGPGAKRVAIELRESLEPQREYIRRTIIQALVATGVLVVLCGSLVLGLGIILVGRPVRRLVEHARRVGEGNLAARVELRQRDEIGELGREFDAMSARLEQARDRLAAETDAKLAAMEQVRRVDRLATVGQLAAGIAHEVGTPLNVIAGYAQLVADDAAPGAPTHEHTAIIIQQVQRVTAIIRQLLDFSRPRPPSKAPHGLESVVRQSAVLLTTIAQKRDVTIRVEIVEPVVVAIDAAQLQQVVANLVVNALHASASGGVVVIEVGQRRAAPPDRSEISEAPHAWISVRDEGPGIPADQIGRIFEPFYTTKDVGEGTGLGLSVAHGIITEHGGWIAVESELGRGSRFTIFLPMQVTA